MVGADGGNPARRVGADRVLGWGGYWASDPVENASLLPWLTATAFLHSVMIQEQREMLRVWNLSLIVLTVGLTLFGTFLTRSGILASVHAFASSPTLGVAFLAFLALVLLVSFGLMGLRSERLRSPAELESLPLIAWRRASPGHLCRNSLGPALLGGGTAGMLAALGIGHGQVLTVAALAAFVVATIVHDVVRGVRARRATEGGGLLRPLASLLLRNRRRYGGFIVHLGVVVFVGVAGSAGYGQHMERTLGPGESLAIGRYRVEFEGLRTFDGRSHVGVAATLRVLDGDQPLGRLEPARGVLFVLAWLGLALPSAALAGGAAPEDAEVEAVARQLRCVVCQNLSVADSPSTMARELIRERLARGESPEEVKAYFVSRYGEWILLTPPAKGFGLVAWAAPAAALAGGLAMALAVLGRWCRSPGVAEPPGVIEAEALEGVRREMSRRAR